MERSRTFDLKNFLATRLGYKLATVRNAGLVTLAGVVIAACQFTQAHAQSYSDAARRLCSSNWATEQLVVPVYLKWIEATDSKTLINFKSNAGRSNMFVRNPRIASETDTEVICRFDIYSNNVGGPVSNVTVKDLDFRYRSQNGAPTWDLIYFPPIPLVQYSDEQVNSVLSKLYVGTTPFMEIVASRAPKPSPPPPRNAMEALGQRQSAYNSELEGYLRSQGVDVDGINRSEAEETRKYAEPCRRSGGTWGRPTDRYGNAGRLGCYHPTGER